MVASSSRRDNNLSSMKIITLLGLSTLSTTVWGYSTTVAEPYAHPFGVSSSDIKRVLLTPTYGDVNPSKNSSLKKKNSISKPSSTYDLGLGKNQPVVAFQGKITPAVSTTETTDSSTEYLIEYQAVREYPSPLTNNGQQVAEVILPPSRRNEVNKKKVLPKVRLQRQAEEHLFIYDADSNEAQPPTSLSSKSSTSSSTIKMVPISKDKLDINTAWVEMLIHSEQMKVAAATI